MDFASHLDEALKKSHLSVAEVAKAAGYPCKLLENFRTGQAIPLTKDNFGNKLLILCKTLDLPYGEMSYLCNKERKEQQRQRENICAQTSRESISTGLRSQRTQRISRFKRDTKKTEPQSLVFISHTSKEADIACAFADLISYSFQLDDNELICTSAEGRGLEKTDNYYISLERHINNAKAVVYIISPSFAKSEDCSYELAWGQHLPKEQKFFFFTGDVRALNKPQLLALTTLNPITSTTLDTLKDALTKQLGKYPRQKTWQREASQLLKVVAENASKDSTDIETKTQHTYSNDITERSSSKSKSGSNDTKTAHVIYGQGDYLSLSFNL